MFINKKWKISTKHFNRSKYCFSDKKYGMLHEIIRKKKKERKNSINFH